MSERIVPRSPQSKADVRNITRYLVEVDLQLGLDFLRVLRASYDGLQTLPEMGKLRFRSQSRITGFRMHVLSKPFGL